MLKLISLSLVVVSMAGCLHSGFRHSGKISTDRQWTSVCEFPKVGWAPWKSKGPRRIRAQAQSAGLHRGILLKDSSCKKAAVLLIPASLSYHRTVLKLRSQVEPGSDRETGEFLVPRIEVEIVGSLKRQKTYPYIWGVVLHEPPILWPEGSEIVKAQ